MITTLTIENFQSIPRAHLDLAAWNAVVGESDTGKSAIIRALYALLTNQRGDYFIRQGERECSVGLTLEDGTAITWWKARGSSGRYAIAYADGSSETFEKTGSEVPARVRELLNMTITVGEAEIMPGFQRQHDAPFLFADSARHRAQVLGEFDGSNLLLEADGLIRRQQRAAQVTAGAQRAIAESTEEALRTLEWVDEAEAAALSAEAACVGVEAQEVRVLAMAGLNMQHAGAAARVGMLVPLVDALAVAAEADVESVARQLVRVAQIQDTLTQVDYSQRVVAASEVAAVVEVPSLDAIDASLARGKAMAGLAWEYEQARAAHAKAGDAVTTAAATVEAAQADLAQLVGVPCPVCGVPMEADHLDA